MKQWMEKPCSISKLMRQKPCIFAGFGAFCTKPCRIDGTETADFEKSAKNEKNGEID